MRTAILLVVSAVSFACAPREDGVNDVVVADGAHGFLVGEIGPVSGINNEATVDANVVDDDFMAVTSYVDYGNGVVVMTRLVTTERSRFLPGMDEVIDTTLDGGISMVACVGPEVGIYNDFDSPADSIHATVDDSEVVTLDAVLRSGTLVVTKFQLP